MMLKRWLAGKTICILLSALVMISGSSSVIAVNAPDQDIYAAAQTNTGLNSTAPASSYTAYLERIKDIPPAKEPIVLRGADYSDATSNGAEIDRAESDAGMESTVHNGETGSITWKVDIPSDAVYSIALRYRSVKGKGSAVERNLLIDGEMPFIECAYLSFPRMFRDLLADGAFEKDYYGNDLRPAQEEVYDWQEKAVSDASGYNMGPLKLAFEAGTHTITLESIQGQMIIDTITLDVFQQLPEYKEYVSEKQKQGYKNYSDTEMPVTIEAEYPFVRSDAMNLPGYDISSPRTSPVEASRILMNTLGGSKWQTAGQWVEWEFDAPEDGLYKIAPRFRQNLRSGMYVCRRLYIDGTIPFLEAENLHFDFSDGWQYKALGGSEGDYLFFFEKGPHKLRFEAVLGDISEILRLAEDSLNVLNSAYLSILKITGVHPDLYRDYNFQKTIPQVIEEIADQSVILYGIAEDLGKMSGTDGEVIQLIKKVAYHADKMGNNPRTIASNLRHMKTNLGALGAWILNVRNQPLEFDFISVCAPDTRLKKAKAGFFEKVFFEIEKLVASFFLDTQSIGSRFPPDEHTENDKVTVWIGSGRDQAMIIQGMIDDMLAAEKNIGVDFQLVAPDALLTAVLAGVGPDVSLSNAAPQSNIGSGVALSNAADIPVNYAARNAVVDLSKLPGFDEVAARFQPSALDGFRFNGGVYGLPETQVYSMLFYRTDIFERYKLTPPDTWAELYTLITELQKQNLTFGMPGNLNTMLMLMFQQGGELYKNNGKAINIDSDIGLDAFKDMCDFYTQYELPLTYDFHNRFRTGEMPAAIMDFTAYNQLTVFAPEIKGKWAFAPIPGTPVTDNSGKTVINRTVPITATSAILLKGGRNTDGGWEFLKWWTSADIQYRFGIEMESLLGPSAKYNTANLEAFSRLPWNNTDYRTLNEQLKNTKGIQVVPGGSYMLERSVNLAFLRVYNYKERPNEVMMEYLDSINSEIIRKLTEFGVKPDDNS